MKILVAVEDKDYGEAVADFIKSHQWPEETQFKVVHVVESMRPGGPGRYSPELADQLSQARILRGRSLVLEISSSLRQAFPHARIEEEVLKGRPKEAIVDAVTSWEADVLAVGSHGRTGLERVFLGSVSLAVLSHAPCSVIVVRLPKVAPAQDASQENDQTASCTV